MELKDKFSEYTSDPSPDAWKHFQMLKESEKPKKKKKWVLGLLILLLFGFLGLGTFGSQLKQEKFLEEDGILEIRQTKPIEVVPNVDNNISLAQIGFSPIREKEGIIIGNTINLDMTHLKTYVTIPVLVESPNEEETQSNEVFVQNDAKHHQIPLVQIPVSSKGDERILVPLDNEENGLYPKVEDSIVLNKTLVLELLARVETDFLAKEEEATLEPIPAKKILKQAPKNNLKLSLGYSDWFLNGIGLDRVVRKRGGSIKLEYYRTLGQLVSLGASTGYIYARDWNNVDFVPKDREREEAFYLHAHLQLFLLNKPKHRAYFKIGGGWNYVNRSRGAFFNTEVRPNIEKYSSIETSMEIGYEYQIKNSWFIGAEVETFVSDERGWHPRISLGRRF